MAVEWSVWRRVLVASVKSFSRDNCADWAAALTYYGVLALFPSAIVIVALVGLVSNGEQTIDTIVDLGRDVGAGSVVASESFTDAMKGVVNQRSSAKVLLSFGLLGALWSASGFTGAFTRASNAIYEVREDRPFYRLRPLQILITAAALLLMAVVATVLVVSGPVTDAVGNALHLGNAPRTVWTILKWPLLLMVMMLLLSLLFWIAPNVQQPRLRWLTVGGAVALISWGVVSYAFGLYVTNFASYDVTYGSLAAVIAFLVWLYLSNCALLFGVEINAELHRAQRLSLEPAGSAIDMERGNSKHGPRLDDEMSREVSGTVQGTTGSRAQEWRQPEPAGEDQADATTIVNTETRSGVPWGMTPVEVEQRSRLGRFISLSALPGTRETLWRNAQENGAPEDLLADLARLPSGVEFQTVSEVWAALGHPNETQRW